MKPNSEISNANPELAAPRQPLHSAVRTPQSALPIIRPICPITPILNQAYETQL
jgi:hypothetical protein